MYIPHFTNGNYALERFWDWVGSVSAGSVGKTLNSFYNNEPFTGIRTVSFDSSYSQSDAYVVKVADNASIADTCAVLFQAESVTGTSNTFLNSKRSGQTNFMKINSWAPRGPKSPSLLCTTKTVLKY